MPETPSKKTSAQAPDFRVCAPEVMRHLRRTLSEALASVDANRKSTRALADRLGIDKTLAWKVSRIVADDEPSAVMSLVPRRPGQRTLIRSLQRAKIAPDLVDSLRTAMDQFETMVETHAGDREALGMMLSELTDTGRCERDEAYRKLSFLGNSAVWGVQARVRLGSYVLTPSDDPGLINHVAVSGLIDFRRLCSDHPWIASAMGGFDDEGQPNTRAQVTPLDASVPDLSEPPLLRDYCSPAPLAIRAVRGPNGLVRYELTGDAIGNSGLTTCIMGCHFRSAQKYGGLPEDERLSYSIFQTTPSENLLFDLFSHKSLSMAMSPTIHSYSALPGHPLYPWNERRALPVVDRVIDLGGGPPDLTAPEMPTYAWMMEWVFKRIGYDPREFHGFRVRVRYPPVPTSYTYEFDAPK